MTSIIFEKGNTKPEDERLQAEWIDTNGLGGWAGSTITGCNSRRYHGLLMAATRPPAERNLLISKLDETIVRNNERFELGTNNYGEVIHPQGYSFLRSFTKSLYPEFEYELAGIILRKSILMINGENTTVIKYEVLKADSSFTLELLPLLASRGYHQLMHSNRAVQQSGDYTDNQYRIRLYDNTPDIYIKIDGSFNANPQWYYNFQYNIEAYRGLDCKEDLFTPGSFSVELKEGQSIYVALSTDDYREKDTDKVFRKEIERRRSLIAKEPDPFVQQLTLASDQFIVKRSEDLKTVIAGYHWFTDWGRDTMISLPGLCLSTGRYEDAKKILSAFARSVNNGMLPNRFQDNGEEPEYNNVDGTLWYFISIYKYLLTTKDKKFVLEELLPVLKEIISWHFKGTRYNIHVDSDGLLYSGEKGYQLTWMDARIGEWVVTPRMGKPVEIQALWYNALCIFKELLILNKQKKEAEIVAQQAEKAKEAFSNKFWFREGNYLYDVIDENNLPDPTLRPNQLLAISLPFELVEGKKARGIIKIIEEKLYTPKGLRSLSPDHPGYISHYGGDGFKRDSAYHQGIVWSWLLGPYIDAIYKTNGSSPALTKAKKVIKNFLPHISEAGIGTISEIFDAEPPFAPRGCIAQAWGVAEILRVIKTYHLYELEPASARTGAKRKEQAV